MRSPTLSGEQLPSVAIAEGSALIGATLVELGAGERRNLWLQQVLIAAAHDLRDKGAQHWCPTYCINRELREPNRKLSLRWGCSC